MFWMDSACSRRGGAARAPSLFVLINRWPCRDAVRRFLPSRGPGQVGAFPLAAGVEL